MINRLYSINLLKYIFLAVMIVCELPAYGSNIDIAPLKTLLSLEKPIRTITLTNLDDAPVTLEVKQYRWMQKNGQDFYEQTKDLIISPPIMKIAPHHEQILRISTRKPVFSETELSYRIFIKEIPQHIPKKSNKEFALQMALQISLPVFVRPVHESIQQLEIDIKKENKDTAQISFKNTGNTHVRVQRITIKSAQDRNTVLADDVLFYLLPTASHTVVLPLKQALNNQILVESELETGTVVNTTTIH